MAREIHDHYFREAKREGYRSRAAYKLIEIDDRRRILRPGDRVLDCGAAPGAWLQVASRRVGERGVVVGIDLKEVRPLGPPLGQRVHVLRGDLRTVPADRLLAVLAGNGPAPRTPPARPARPAPAVLFDVVLSDMAPDTTGDRTMDHHQSVRLAHAVLDRTGPLLRPGGHLVVKVFEGEAYPELLGRVQAMFAGARGFRPQASRAVSREMFVVGKTFRGSAADPHPPPTDAPPRRPAPVRGWGRTESGDPGDPGDPSART